jgi:hypothetical protein
MGDGGWGGAIEGGSVRKNPESREAGAGVTWARGRARDSNGKGGEIGRAVYFCCCFMGTGGIFRVVCCLFCFPFVRKRQKNAIRK